MRILAALSLVAALALSGCSEDDAQDAVDQAKDAVSSAVDDADLPDVDWDKYGDQLKSKLDEMADAADCEALQAQLDKRGALNTEVVDYIKAKLKEAGC